MELKWNYGQGVLVLPAAVLSADAEPRQLQALLWLASDASLASKPLQLARLAGVSGKELEEILHFWMEKGVLTTEGELLPTPTQEAKAKRATAPKKIEPSQATEGSKTLQRAAELPVYKAEELSRMMEEQASLRMLVDASQQTFGKMFNPMELNILFGMADFLGLSEEYILLLLAHCKRVEVKSMRYVERLAVSLVDQGVTTVEALEEKVRSIEAAHTLEGKVRSMFGLKSRALTAKEKKFIAAWSAYGYGEEIISRAYEITIGNINEPSLPYANSILERWHSEGVRTLEELEAKLAAEKAEKTEKEGTSTLGNSFDTDDFFEAALKKSFEQMGVIPEGKD